MVPTMAMMTMTYPIKIQLAWMISGSAPGAPIRGSGHLKASSRRQRSVISQGRRMALHQPATSRQLAFSNKASSNNANANETRDARVPSVARVERSRSLSSRAAAAPPAPEGSPAPLLAAPSVAETGAR